MERNAFLDLGLQRLQLIACRRVQVAWLDVLGNDRVIVLRADRAQRVLEALLLSELALLAATIASSATTGSATSAGVSVLTPPAVVAVPAKRGTGPACLPVTTERFAISAALTVVAVSATVRGTIAAPLTVVTISATV
ncbi:hypothetical protein SD72_06990, partial [Leucobacter komagatae]